jgi:AraC-like DNA-binding protein
MRYLRGLRMERAKDLLESSFLSVKEIAYRVGLNDESHFVRDFKSTYGSSPALYRVHFRQDNGGESHIGDSPNGNGNGNGEQSNNLRQQLARAAKQSVLPSIHIVIYMMSLAC